MSDSDDALSPDVVPLIEAETDVFGAVDPDEQPGGRRRRHVVLIAAVAAVALVGGLLVWQPWSSDESASPTTSEPTLSSELVIDVDGVTLSRSLQSSGEFDTERAQEGFIFAAPGANLDTGPLLAFLVDDLTDGETIDSGETTVEIDGHEATVEDAGDGIEIYWEGEPGVRYGVAGAGVPQARVIAFAEAVSFENGVTTVDDPDVIDGMEPAGDVATLFGILGMIQPFFSSGADAITQEYTTEQGDTFTLASIAAGGEFSGLASLLLDDERTFEVDGTLVVIGGVTGTFGVDEENLQVLLTLRGGRLIGITATDIDDDGLLALLAAVRPATDDEWATVLSVVEDPMDDFLSSDEDGDVGGETVPATALSDETEP